MKAINFLIVLLAGACSSHQEKPDSIRDMMLTKVNTTRQCYIESDSYGKKQPIKLKHKHVIKSDGTTKDHEIIEQDVKDPNFSSCFLTQMKTIKYEMPLILPVEPPKDDSITLEPTGSITVIQPFTFRPGN